MCAQLILTFRLNISEAMAQRLKHSQSESKSSLLFHWKTTSVFHVYFLPCRSIPLVEVSKCDASSEDNDDRHHEDSEDKA